MEMTKVHLSSLRSTLAHKYSALKIDDTGLQNLCSNLLPLEVDKHLPLLPPDPFVPGVSPEVLQRVLSQASTASV